MDDLTPGDKVIAIIIYIIVAFFAVEILANFGDIAKKFH